MSSYGPEVVDSPSTNGVRPLLCREVWNLANPEHQGDPASSAGTDFVFLCLWDTQTRVVSRSVNVSKVAPVGWGAMERMGR
jgi:hypothetical protein